MLITHNNTIIELIDDMSYTFNSVDNVHAYENIYYDGMSVGISVKHGVKIIEDNILSSSALICSDGLSTTIHQRSYIIKNNTIFICCGRHVYALNVLGLNLNWCIEADFDQCIGIYSFDEDIIIHGLQTVSRITKDGAFKWQTQLPLFNNHKIFEIVDRHLLVGDIDNYQCVIDYKGDIIS